MRTLTFLGLFLLAACGGPPAPVAGGPRRVVVLELQNPAGLTGQEVAYVGELVRGAALHLPAARYRILTRENLTELIGPDVDLADCTGDCEIETARRIGADFVVTGEAVRFGEGLRVVLKLHDARTAALLGTDRASARTVEGLERPVEAAGQRLFAALGAGGREAPQAVDPGQYVRVEPGEFTAGSPEGEPGRAAHEAQARVRIPRPFLIKITEVTRAEWRRHFDRDPSRFTGCGDDCPVEQVSWFDAVAWLNAASAAEGLQACYAVQGCKGQPGAGDLVCARVRSVPDCTGYRLPTRAEWAYAARAGATGPTPEGALGLKGRYHATALAAHAWYGGNSGVTWPGGEPCAAWRDRAEPAERCGPHPVGLKAPNAWGLFDALGNVAEWTETGTGSGASGVRWYRGGSWRSAATEVRHAAMIQAAPTLRDGAVGFRPVRSLP